jgi:formyltetrahydrofolate deformylase
MTRPTARLLISCPDRPGLIAAVAGFVSRYGGNILEADQHSDPDSGEFFMRIEVDLIGFGLDRDSFQQLWSQVANQYRMRWRVYWGTHVKRMAILVTKESHCLNDLLWRWRTEELPVAIPLVIGNRPELREQVEALNIPFHHLPVTPELRPAQEGQIRSLMEAARIDFVVLARYMQILSPELLHALDRPIINIHHGFLPAFAGPKPYHQAYERGVKLIGATSHYVTEELDNGPIIAQATWPIDHRDAIDDLIRKGRDLERVVLAEAVRLHVEDKILLSGRKTIVFD